jgi:hypothetical protein
MDDEHNELMKYIAAALAKEKGSKGGAAPKPRAKPRSAAPPVNEINGIEIVEDGPRAAAKPRAAPRRAVAAPEEAAPAIARPAKAPAARPAARRVHTCNCDMCPMK